ncbi:protein LSM14 homolog car-1 isoform X5 [Macrobrachium rosenbergii]|uniref:protein LSM14 homolog car-1 isoform X5 n=1 Tax=Macrobrachium rosenbergii TaxID=79674 RepID=UPI0034D53CA2
MSGPIPFLGSKISLISKSEIRYEGILYTIDAQESIIALAKVRSFGTEDRPTEMPVPARDEVYEYIIFRGTDIKKIEVCDTPKQPTLPGGLHNDPAIVQHSAPTVPSSFQAAPFSRQSLGPIGEIIVGSRSSTPTARKSPVSDAGVQVSPPPRDDKKKSPQGQRPMQQEGGQRSSNQVGSNRKNSQPQQQSQPVQHNASQNQYHNHYPYQHHPMQYQGRGGGMGRGRGTRRPTGARGRGQAFNQANRQRQFQDQQIFEQEYDFEQANEEFEELRNQLSKTKIVENGEKKDDSGHETGTGDESTEDHATFYDKSKSFFDSISCEAIERSKGKSQRPDWRLERKINVETFGVSSARRGYFPRGRGGYFRGGYRNYNYNQGYYRGGGGGSGSTGYRGGRGASRGGVNGVSQRGGAVRNSTPTK